MSIHELRDFIGPLFAELGSPESLKILALLFGAFLIGWLFGNLRWRGRHKRLKKAFKAKEAELVTVQANYDSSQEQLTKANADLLGAKEQVTQLETSLGQLERDKSQLNADLHTLKNEYQEVQTRNESYASKIHDLETNREELTQQAEQAKQQLAEARTQIQELEVSNANFSTELAAVQNQQQDYLDQINQLQSELENRPTQPIEFIDDDDVDEIEVDDITTNLTPNTPTLDRLAAIEERLTALADENEKLRDQLSSSPSGSASDDTLDHYEEAEELESEEGNGASRAAQKALAEAFGKRLPQATAEDRDDLKSINGIGPFLEEKLNKIGIYTFEQISLLDDELIDWITQAIQFFPGRIKRDDWVGQATALVSN